MQVVDALSGIFSVRHGDVPEAALTGCSRIGDNLGSNDLAVLAEDELQIGGSGEG